MKDVRSILATTLSILIAMPAGVFAASHREAPLTALDHAADITDFFAFRSYENPSTVTFILDVDPFLEPGNGPNYFPFDPSIVYAIHVDNTYDAMADISFEFQFTTNILAPVVFTGFVGAGSGINAPANAPTGGAAANGSYSVNVGQPVIPPAITSLTGPGAAGLSLQQTYTVTMVQGSGATAVRTPLGNGQTLIAVPSNVGPRTMPNYPALAAQGIFSLGNGIQVFAGTVDDPFYIDLGATFDSLNYRPNNFFAGATSASGAVLPVLSAAQDANDTVNFQGVDMVSGYNVNCIAIQVPIAMVTQPGKPVIGTWGTTSRLQTTVMPANPIAPAPTPSSYVQVQRMGNPLINELIIGTGSKDTFSMSPPSQDAQFAAFALNPLLPRVLNAVFGIPVPDPPRTDLLPLVQYSGPFAGAGSSPGPVADLLRLDTSVAPTPMASRRRLGLLVGDAAGFPNGRRVSDDVTDIALRVVAGVLCSGCTSGGQAFYPANVPLLGDGVNTNDRTYQEVFPYVAWAHDGRDRRHVDPSETACAPNCP